MKTNKIEFSPDQMAIKDFFEREIAKRGELNSLAIFLGVNQSAISKTINKYQAPSKNLIKTVLNKYGYNSILALMEDNLQPIVKTENKESAEDILKIGLDFSMGSVPILLALSKSPLLSNKIKGAYHYEGTGTDKKIKIMGENEVDTYDFENTEIFNDRFNTLDLQNHLNTSELDAIILPDGSLDFNFDIKQVARIGSIDPVMSIIGNYKEDLMLEKKSENKYLGDKKDFFNFLKDKVVVDVYFQNSIAREKYKMFRALHDEDLKDCFKIYDNLKTENMNVDSDNIHAIANSLRHNEIIIAIGFAPIPLLLFSEIRKINKNIKHLPFNTTSILPSKKVNFWICVHKRILFSNSKLKLLTQLINEVNYACTDLKEYQNIYRNKVKEDSPIKIYKENVISRLEISENDMKEIKNINKQDYIFKLHKFFYATKNGQFQETDAVSLYQRTLLNHVNFDLGNMFKYQFVIDLLNRFTGK